ncbi:Cu_bind_like domain-containing protein, partial [Cephalotus follicularis]
VGDSAGWTGIGHVNYHKCAVSMKFHVGDTIFFEYNKQHQNVMRVKHQQFDSCNTTSPITIYTSSYDKITLNRSGHYYFICGFPQHCDNGQKVNIKV